MKNILKFTAFALVLGIVASASAQTLLSTIAASVRDASVQEDQSNIPDQSNREGYVAYVFDVLRDGGSGAIAVGPVLPDNVAVVDGFVQVTTAFLPADATNTVAFSVLAANDIRAATQMTAGVHLLNVASASYINAAADGTNVVQSFKVPVVTTNAASQLTMTFAGAPATNGVAYVWLKLVKVQ